MGSIYSRAPRLRVRVVRTPGVPRIRVGEEDVGSRVVLVGVLLGSVLPCLENHMLRSLSY